MLTLSLILSPVAIFALTLAYVAALGAGLIHEAVRS